MHTGVKKEKKVRNHIEVNEASISLNRMKIHYEKLILIFMRRFSVIPQNWILFSDKNPIVYMNL